jgi:serine/threonine protein kinase
VVEQPHVFKLAHFYFVYRDTYNVDNMQIVANELAVSAMLSSLARRAICPNFIMLRGVFTCGYPPPESHWGNEENKNPNGLSYEQLTLEPPRTPKNPEPGHYQYIRMELVSEGDAEETSKRQRKEVFDPATAQSILFQIAFTVYAAADKFLIKHNDVKLLNIFLQNIGGKGDVVLRYGLGSHVFSLRMPSRHGFLAKLADFGTANICYESNGQPVTIAHFTTLENTPPDFMILGGTKPSKVMSMAALALVYVCFTFSLAIVHTKKSWKK